MFKWMPTSISKNEKGLTMTELMVSLVILSIIIILWATTSKHLVYYNYLNSQLSAQEEAKSALYLMSKEIRGARDIANADIQPTSITFYTINGAVSYYLDSTTNELIRASSDTSAIPLIPPIRRTTILRDVNQVNPDHPRLFYVAGKMITIDIVVKKPFIESDKANMRFKTEVCVRNP